MIERLLPSGAIVPVELKDIRTGHLFRATTFRARGFWQQAQENAHLEPGGWRCKALFIRVVPREKVL